ncbi:MAG: DUF308 domain-containing protein [Bacteroidales bacterium]
MLQLLLKKWWMLLLQGILLVILSAFIFNNPAAVLAGISFWFGVIILASGLIGILNWFAASSAERENMSILWSVITFLFGILLLSNILATMGTLSMIFGLWVLVSSVLLVKSGWLLKKVNPAGWFVVIIGALSVVAAVIMIFNISAGAIAISTVLGLQVFLTGVALILLSFTKKAVVATA